MEVSFSIIIPTYNRGNVITETINSVLHQELKDFEVIVVDDGSTDNTELTVKNISDNRIHYFKKQNGERAAARNYGVVRANGRYITFLDSDDKLYANYLKTAEETIRAKNRPALFHLGYEVVGSKNEILTKYDGLPVTVNQLLIKGNCLSCIGVFLRSDIAKSNLFNEDRDLSACEDWELWLRIAAQFPIYTNNKVTAALMNHGNRSVLDADNDKLIKRIDVFLKYVLANRAVTEYYKNKLNLLKSSCYTYISLHIALTGKNKNSSIKYLIKGIIESPASLFSRRFMAILKHLLR